MRPYIARQLVAIIGKVGGQGLPQQTIVMHGLDLLSEMNLRIARCLERGRNLFEDPAFDLAWAFGGTDNSPIGAGGAIWTDELRRELKLLHLTGFLPR